MSMNSDCDRAAYLQAAKDAAQKQGRSLDVSMRGIGNVLKTNLDLPRPSTNDLFFDLLGRLDKRQIR